MDQGRKGKVPDPGVQVEYQVIRLYQSPITYFFTNISPREHDFGHIKGLTNALLGHSDPVTRWKFLRYSVVVVVVADWNDIVLTVLRMVQSRVVVVGGTITIIVWIVPQDLIVTLSDRTVGMNFVSSDDPMGLVRPGQFGP